MKTKKKVIVLLLALTMVAVLAVGCANTGKKVTQPNIQQPTNAPTSNESGEQAGHPEGGEEGGDGESGDPSSPILQLDESWDGVVNGMRVAMSYDATSQTFSGTVENVTSQTIKAILIELNLKQGTKTVVELGPQPVGDLAPGQQANVELRVADEPLAQGLTFDAWEIHPEAEGTGGEGAEGGEGTGEQHGAEGGSEGNESGESSEKGSTANYMSLTDTYDVTKNGARLILAYDKNQNAFIGSVENTTQSTLTRARVEIHLDNGVELGPTTPTDLAPGAKINITLKATDQAFTGWVTHCEVGAAEGGEGTESGGEHGSGEGSEGGGEGAEGGHDEGSEGGNG